MACPFPGMDPYLEDPAFWPDFHRSFITYFRDALFDRLPEEYEASIDETMRIVIPDELETVHFPDVGVTAADTTGGTAVSAGTAVALEPVTLPTGIEEVRDVWLEVRHRPERSLITVIEVLSPANKIGREAALFAARRDRLLQAGVHVVELNLLLGGRRPEISSPWPAGEYYARVARAGTPPTAGVKSWHVLDPLPAIPIPLRSPDPDVCWTWPQFLRRLTTVAGTPAACGTPPTRRGRCRRTWRPRSRRPCGRPGSGNVSEWRLTHDARSGTSKYVRNSRRKSTLTQPWTRPCLSSNTAGLRSG